MEVARVGHVGDASHETAEQHMWIADGFSGDLVCVSYLVTRQGSEAGVFKQSRVIKREEGEAARSAAADRKSEWKREAPLSGGRVVEVGEATTTRQTKKPPRGPAPGSLRAAMVTCSRCRWTSRRRPHLVRRAGVRNSGWHAGI